MIDPNRFRKRLESGPILLDGAIGTRLIARGLKPGENEDSALWNQSHPDAVAAIHALDIAAGADALFTNTFLAHRSSLARFGRESAVAAINRRAVELARAAAGPDRLVIGSIGPRATVEREGGHHGLVESYREQARALCGSGVDALILETHRMRRAAVALGAIRDVVGVPILVSLYRWPDSSHAARIERAVNCLVNAGADGLGVNCVADLDTVAALAGALCAVSAVPVLLKPSAWVSQHALTPPADFAAAVPVWLERGARLIGGCCGADESHIAAMRQALDAQPRGRL